MEHKKQIDGMVDVIRSEDVPLVALVEQSQDDCEIEEYVHKLDQVLIKK